MCTRIEIIITMIFLFKKNRQPTYAIPAFSQHKTILLKNNNSASFQSGLELEVLLVCAPLTALRDSVYQSSDN